MKKLIPIFIALLFIVSSCIPQPTSEIILASVTPLPIPTVTPTPLPNISPLEWASDESGVVTPQKMFLLVGAIDKRHRRTLDLDYGGLRIALVLGKGIDLQDEKYIATHREIRSFYAVELNKQEALKQQLERLRAMLDSQGTTQDSVVIIEGQNWPNDISVSPTSAYVSQVVEFGDTKQDEIRTRYVLENGVLGPLSKEEEPLLLHELYVDGNKFMAEGKEIILRGAVANHGYYYHVEYSTFLKDINWMKTNSANFVSLMWSYGFLTKPGYIEKIVKMTEYAKSQGLRVELTLRGEGLKPGSTWDVEGITIGDERVYTAWEDLLKDPDIAKRLANSVDIFGPASELEKDSSGSYISWPTAKDLESRTGKMIRQKLGKPDAIIAFTPPGFAGDLRGVVGNPPDLLNSVVETHPYQWIDKIADFETYSIQLKNKGILVFAGEFGWADPIPFTEKQYQFMIENGISFAVSAISSDTDNPNTLYILGGVVTDRGQLAIKYWSYNEHEWE